MTVSKKTVAVRKKTVAASKKTVAVRKKVAAKNAVPDTRGLALSEEIKKKMTTTGTGPVEVSALFGHSPSYVNSLLNLNRPWDGTPRDTKKKIAKFLGVPLISVLMLGGIVEPEDFIYEDTIEDSLNNAFSAIKSHPTWGSFCKTKTEWNSLPLNARILIALLYEKTMEVEIIQKARMIKIVEPGEKQPRGKRAPSKSEGT